MADKQTGVEKMASALEGLGYRCKGTVRDRAAKCFFEKWYGPGPDVIVQVHERAGFEVFAPVSDSNEIAATVFALECRIHAGG